MFSDETFILRSKKGDSHAFGQLIKQYQKELYNFIFSQVFNNIDTERIFQETCLAAWNKISLFKKKDSFYSFLCSIAGDKVDEKLVLKSKEGNRSAFSQLVVRYQEKMKTGFLVKQLKFSEEDAEELFQEACLIAWSKISVLKEVNSFFPWFRKIIQNKAREHWREDSKGKNSEIHIGNWDENIKQNKKGNLAKEDTSTPINTKPWFINPLICLIDEFQEDCVKRKINLLPENLREVISLRISGFGHKEIAKKCNISYAKVKQRIFRARSKLVNEYKVKECFE